VRRAGRSPTGGGPISQRCVALAEREVGPRSRDRRGGSATSGVARPSFAPARAHHYGTTGERHWTHPGCHSCHPPRTTRLLPNAPTEAPHGARRSTARHQRITADRVPLHNDGDLRQDRTLAHCDECHHTFDSLTL
jgi:hypothetical protein